MRRLVPLLVLAAALVVGLVWGWKLVLAPLLGLVIWAWARATLRSFMNDGATGTAANTEPTEVPLDERTLYWCEDCGTELVLIMRGSGIPPRHCGSRMHERSELLH